MIKTGYMFLYDNNNITTSSTTYLHGIETTNLVIKAYITIKQVLSSSLSKVV